MKHTRSIRAFNTFSRLGCSGAAVGSFVNGVLPNEETCDVCFQILGSDLQTLHDFYVQHTENMIVLASHKGLTPWSDVD